MNQTAANVHKNPWKSPDGVPSAPLVQLLLASLAFLCAALQLAFLDFPFFSYITIAVGIAYTVAAGRSKRVTLSVLALTALLTLPFGSPMLGASALALVVGISAGAFLATSVKSPMLWLLPLLPAAAAAVAWIVKGTPWAAAWALWLLPALLALTVATRQNLSRTGAIAATIGGLLVSVLITVAIAIYVNAGALTLDTVRSSVDYVRQQLIGLVQQATDAYFESLLRQSATLTDLTPELLETYQRSIESARAAFSPTACVNLAFDLLPAITVLLCGAIALQAQMLLCYTYLTAKMQRVLSPRVMCLSASVTAAILFDASFFVQLLAAGTMAGAVAQNLFWILFPLFLLIGWSSLQLRLSRTSRGSRRTWIILLLAALFCCSATILLLLLYLIAFTAAGQRILTAIRNAFAHSSGNHGND